VKPALLAMTLLGGLLLAGVVRDTDLVEVWHHLTHLGAGGIAALLAVHAVRTLADATSWLLTLPSVRPSPRWLGRAWAILLAAAALELVTPLGGEPMKAVVLKRHYGVPYTETGASLVLTRAARSARLVRHDALDGARSPVREPYWCHKHRRTCLPTVGAQRFLRRRGRAQEHRRPARDLAVDEHRWRLRETRSRGGRLACSNTPPPRALHILERD